MAPANMVPKTAVSADQPPSIAIQHRPIRRKVRTTQHNHGQVVTARPFDPRISRYRNYNGFTSRASANDAIADLRRALAKAKAATDLMPELLGPMLYQPLPRIKFDFTRLETAEPAKFMHTFAMMSPEERLESVQAFFHPYHPTKLVVHFLRMINLNGLIRLRTRPPCTMGDGSRLNFLWPENLGDNTDSSNIIERHVYSHFDPSTSELEPAIPERSILCTPDFADPQETERRRQDRNMMDRVARHKRRKLMHGVDAGRTWDGLEELKYPAWKNIQIPVIPQTQYPTFRQLRNRVTILDLVHYHLLGVHVDYLNKTFDKLESKTAENISDSKVIKFWRLVCSKFEHYMPMFPMSLDCAFDMAPQHTKEEWASFACDFFGEKVTRYTKYGNKMINHFARSRKLTKDDFVEVMSRATFPLLVLDLLTIDYPNAYTALTYMSANYPMSEEERISGMTTLETSLVDEILTTMKKISEHDIDLLDHAFLKLLMFFHSYGDERRRTNDKLYNLYSDIETHAHRLIELRNRSVYEDPRSMEEEVEAVWMSWRDILQHCTSIAAKFQHLNPLRYPAVIKSVIHVSYMNHRSVPAIVPLEYNYQLLFKRPTGERNQGDD